MASYLANHKRTHMCGALRAEHIGREVTLFGWVDNQRDMAQMVFLVLRDRTGTVQVRFDEDLPDDIYAAAKTVRQEWCVAVRGEVVSRGTNANEEQSTGAVEVVAREVEVFNRTAPLPFPIRDEVDATENTRLQYRYLDLRRGPLQRTLQIRSRVNHLARNYLVEQGFLEVETPILTKSTPEGARDYLVPSRVNPGTFFALPQSPQLFKQILMVSGFDRYYQIVRCFRDEDLRADRQPEFTQIDLEMSFVEMDDVMGLCEGLTRRIFENVLGGEIRTPFPRLGYDEAMRRFGVDAPDLRFGMEIVDVSEDVGNGGFKVFRDATASGGVVRGLRVEGGAEALSRKDIGQLEELAKVYGARGLATTKVAGGRLETGIAKFLGEDEQRALLQRFGAGDGDLLLFVADDASVVCPALGYVRKRLGKELNLYEPDALAFCWVVGFPMFERDEERGRYVAVHHPFTAPLDEDLDRLESHPLEVRAKAYDLVLNGMETAGGSIRIHRSDVQQRVFRLLGIDEEEARAKFGFLLDALSFGAPAPRRRGLWHGSADHEPGRSWLDPGRDRLPQDPARRRLDVRGARAGRPGAARGAAPGADGRAPYRRRRARQSGEQRGTGQGALRHPEELRSPHRAGLLGHPGELMSPRQAGCRRRPWLFRCYRRCRCRSRSAAGPRRCARGRP